MVEDFHILSTHMLQQSDPNHIQLVKDIVKGMSWVGWRVADSDCVSLGCKVCADLGRPQMQDVWINLKANASNY